MKNLRLELENAVDQSARLENLADAIFTAAQSNKENGCFQDFCGSLYILRDLLCSHREHVKTIQTTYDREVSA